MNRIPFLHGVLKADDRHTGRAGPSESTGLAAKARRSLLAGTALAGFVIGGVMVAPQQALATCALDTPNDVLCDGGGTQTPLTPFAPGGSWTYFIVDDTAVTPAAGGAPVITITAGGHSGTFFIEEGSSVNTIDGSTHGVVIQNGGDVTFLIDGAVNAQSGTQAQDAIRLETVDAARFFIGATGVVQGYDDGILIRFVEDRPAGSLVPSIPGQVDSTGLVQRIPGFVHIENKGKIIAHGRANDPGDAILIGNSDTVNVDSLNTGACPGVDCHEPVAAIIYIDNSGSILGDGPEGINPTGTGADQFGFGIGIRNLLTTAIRNYTNPALRDNVNLDNDGGVIYGGRFGIIINNHDGNDNKAGGVVSVENYNASIRGGGTGILIRGAGDSEVQILQATFTPQPFQGPVFLPGQVLLNSSGDPLLGNPEGDFQAHVLNYGGSLIEGLGNATPGPSVASVDVGAHGVWALNSSNVLVQNYGSIIRGTEGTNGDESVGVLIEYDFEQDSEQTYAVVVNSGTSAATTITIVEDGNEVEVDIPAGSDGTIQGTHDAVRIVGTGAGIPIGFNIPFITHVGRGGFGGGEAEAMWDADRKVAFNSVVINFNKGTMWGTDGDAVDIENGGRVLVVNSGPGSLMRGSDDSGVEITTDSDGDRDGYALVWNRNNAEIRGREDGVFINQIGRGGEFFRTGGKDYTVAVVNVDASVIRSRRGDAVDIENTRGAVLVYNQAGDAGGNGWMMGRDSGIEIQTVRGRNIDAEGWVGGFVVVENGTVTEGKAGGFAIVTGRGNRNNPVINIDDVRGNDGSDDRVGVYIHNGPLGIMGSRNLPGMPSVRSSVTPIEDLIAGRDVSEDGETYQFIKDQSLFRQFTDSLGHGYGFNWHLAEQVKDLLPDYRRAARDRLARIDDIDRGMILWDNEGFMAGRVNLEADEGIEQNVVGIWFTRGTNRYREPGSDNDSVLNIGDSGGIYGWVQTALNPNRRERTSFRGLDFMNNYSLLSMMDHETGDRTRTTGDYTGYRTGGSRAMLGIDVHFGQPRDEVDSWSEAGRADRFRIGGDAYGNTGLLIEIHADNTHDNPGGINHEGIRVVRIEGSSENPCFDVLCDSSNTFFIDPWSQNSIKWGGYDMVQLGFFAWGATEREISSSDVFLVSDWAPQAYQMPSLISGAQNIWYESTSVVSDHIYGNLFPRVSSAPADDRVVKGAVPAPAPRTSALWIKVTGAWTDRDGSTKATNWGGTDTTLTANTGYKQDTYNIIGGIDGGGASGSGVWRGGLFGGYTSSGLKFDFGGAKADYDGWLVGGYLAYVQGGGYADVMVRADFLDVDYKAWFGKKGTDAQSIGVMANLGHRTDSGSAFFEPIASFAYVNTDMDNFTLGGANVRFGDGTSLRLGGGARVGASMASGGHVAEFSLLAKLWNEFHNNKVRLTDIASGTTTSFSDDAKGLFGEVVGSATMYSTDRSLSGFLSAGAKFNSDFLTLTAKAGLRKAF